MDIKAIKTDEDYHAAIALMEALDDKDSFQEDPALIAQFKQLAALVKLYENEHFPLRTGHPLEIIRLKMAMSNVKQKDLIPYMGTSGVISDVFNKKRGLSKAMIRALSDFLHIDQEILNTPYDLQVKKARAVKVIETRARFAFIPKDNGHFASFKKQVRTTGMLFNMNSICV